MSNTSLTVVSGTATTPPAVIEKKEDPEPEGILDSSEKRRIFVQVAAMNHGDVASTFAFCRSFIFGDSVKLHHVRGLLSKYRDEIMESTSALQAFMANSKFDHLSAIKQAEVVNRGVRNTALQIEIAEKQIVEMNKAEGSAADYKKLDQMARRCNILVNQFQKWMLEKERWIIRVEDEMKRVSYLDLKKHGNAEQRLALDAQKLSLVMRRNGVLPEIADRVSGLIVTGDYFITDTDKEIQGEKRYMLNEADEEGDGEDGDEL